MLRTGPAPDIMTMNTVMTLLADSQQWARALQIFDAVPKVGLVPTEVTFGAALGACARGRQGAAALRVLDAAWEGGGNVNWISCTSAIFACGKASLWADALRIFCDMRRRRPDPDAKALGMLFAACRRRFKTEEVLRYLADADATLPGADGAADDARGSAPQTGAAGAATRALRAVASPGGARLDAVTFTSEIGQCQGALRWERAAEVLLEMHLQAVQSNNFAFTAFVASGGRNWQWTTLQLREARARSCADESVHNAVLSSCHRAWTRSLVLLESMSRSWMRPMSRPSALRPALAKAPGPSDRHH